MEKGPSTYAEYWTSSENEVDHFCRHGWQMCFAYNIDGYSEAARDLALADDTTDILSYERDDGCICKFNKNNRFFVVINKEGKIVTFFKIKAKNYMKDYERWNAYWGNKN